MPLHDVLASRAGEIVARWRTRILGDVVHPSVPPLELIDHIPEFLAQLAVDMATGAAIEPRRAANDSTAADHGAQRLRLGFSLDAVVREYGALREVIVEVARDHEGHVEPGDLDMLFAAVIDGIAHAVVEYTNQRDAELRRQANEHFAFIAHELRNPLSSATLAFDTLRARGELPEGSRAVLVIDRGLRRTSDLVDQVLRTARVASGLTLRRQPTTLRALFADAEMSATLDADGKDIEIRTEIDGEDEVSIDTRLVQSAIGNLLQNAVKHTHAGEFVVLRGRIDDGRAVVEVEDRCGGLPPGKVEQAFSPFVRLGSDGDGFGLGLAIAKQAVDAHGGNIRVQNLPGTGCIFVLELPLAG
jgi:signal transduction histidine kinase